MATFSELLPRGLSSWLTNHPMQIMLAIVVAQIALLAFVATSVNRLRFAQHARAASAVWLSSIVIVLTLLPVHGLLQGWTISLSDTAARGKQQRMGTIHNGGSSSSALGTKTVRESSTTSHDSRAADAFGLTIDKRIVGDPAGFSVSSQPEGALPTTIDTRPERVDAQSAAGAMAWYGLAGTVYASGLLYLFLRMVFGTRRLQAIAANGQLARAVTSGDATQIAKQLGLSQIPQVRICNQVKLPLMFGVLHPTVIVPRDFEAWPRSQQRAVLWHEFAHAARWDMMGELLSRTMQALYWFHPACWYLARQWNRSRELATDERVVEAGVDGASYASDLVDVLARLCPLGSTRLHSLPPALSMASSVDIEQRLRHILRAPARRSELGWRCLMVGVLAAVIATTTVRFESSAVQAQSQPVRPSGEPERPDTFDSKAIADNLDNDLIYRMRHCEVFSVEGEEFNAIFDVSGQVRSPAGEPIAGATVLLRESSTDRLSAEHQRFASNQKRSLTRVPEVFARTTTDASGHFHFQNVKSPAFPKFWTNRWRGDVVAAHEDHGIGWMNLSNDPKQTRVERTVAISLGPTVNLSGTCVSPDDQSIENGIVNLHQLQPLQPDQSERQHAGNLDLQFSQLTPRAVTDANGHFTLTSIPQGMAANVSVNHDDWVGAGAIIATSENVAVGPRSSTAWWPADQPLVSSPARLVADAGVRFSCRVVDQQQRPIPEVRVSINATENQDKADADGRLQTQLSTMLLKRLQQTNEPQVLFLVRPPEGSGYLHRYFERPLNDVLAEGGEVATIELQRGIPVKGKVETPTGEPIADAVVYRQREQRELIYGGRTNAQGEYDFLLPLGVHTLLVGSEQPGYQLPSEHAVVTAYRHSTQGWPQQVVDLSSGRSTTVKPIVVRRLAELPVRVTLPNGQPAVGAKVVARDTQNPPHFNEISTAMVTDRHGATLIAPTGSPTPAAVVEATLTEGATAYRKIVPLSHATEAGLEIALGVGRRLQGRVTRDGQPLEGVTMAVEELQPFQRQEGRLTIPGATVSYLQTVVTDNDGWYRVVVAPDQQYTARVQLLPGYDHTPAMGLIAKLATPDVLEVPEFAFSSDLQELAGTVIDASGAPVAGARIRVDRVHNSDLWLGHLDESQFKTDSSGRFHLRKMPAGKYRLQVTAPGEVGRPPRIHSFEASTGDMQLQFVIE